MRINCDHHYSCVDENSQYKSLAFLTPTSSLHPVIWILIFLSFFCLQFCGLVYNFFATQLSKMEFPSMAFVCAIHFLYHVYQLASAVLLTAR